MDLSQALNNIGQLLVQVLYAVVVLFVGWVIAKIVAALVGKLLHWLKLDERIGKAAGETKVPQLEKLFTLIAYYLILLFAVIAALQVLGLTIVTQLFISPGHNYYGHHGQSAGDHPIVDVGRIECVAGHGVRGDRFFDYQPDYVGQITFFDMDVIEALARELNLAGVRPEFTRRNVFTRGVDLNTLIGVEFEIQGVRFVGIEECRPCYWMNNAFRNERVETWLQGHGGLRARILTDGVLTCGTQGAVI